MPAWKKSNIKLVFPDMETETKLENTEQGNESKKYDAVIVGAGIAGLITAVEASRAGKNILVIEKRKEKLSAIRSQLVYIPYRDYLIKLCGSDANMSVEDKKFIESIEGGGRTFVALKDTQRYLKQRIDNRYCTFSYESIVSAVNLEKGQLVISHALDASQQKKTNFDYLIIADGSHHSTGKLLSPDIQYQAGEAKSENPHIMAYLTIKSKDGTPVEIPIHRNPMPVLYGDYFGYIVFENKTIDTNKVKADIILPLSSELAKKFRLNEERAMDFAYHCMSSVFDGEKHDIFITKSRKSGAEKDKLKCLVFNLDAENANVAAIEKNGNIAALVGDAYMTAGYAGYGTTHAISGGQAASSLIQGQMSVAEYNKSANQMHEENSSRRKMRATDKKPKRFIEIPPFDKPAPMADYGSKLHSGKVRLFSFTETKNSDSSPTIDEIPANKVKR